MKQTSVAVIHCRIRGYPEECVAEARPAGELLLVHDSSLSADRLEALREKHPDIRTILAPEDADRAQVLNLAVKNSSGENLLLLQSDTILAPDTLRMLEQQLSEDERLGAVGANLTFENGITRRSRRPFPILLRELLDVRPFVRGLLKPIRRIPAVPPVAAPRKWMVDSVAPNCVLLRRAALEQAGEFADGFDFQFEMTDWCWRAKKRGFLTCVLIGARAYVLTPQQIGPLPPAMRLVHLHSLYRLARRNKGAVFCTLLRGARVFRALMLLVISAIGFVLTLMKSRTARRELRAAVDILKWHASGCPKPDHDPLAESDFRWEILG